MNPTSEISTFEDNAGLSHRLIVAVLKKKGIVSRLECNRNKCFGIYKLNDSR